ncbi:MAG: hypothetical protein ACXW1Z_22120, partial [Methylobacter sp.]
MLDPHYSATENQARSLLSELIQESKLYKHGQDYQDMLDFVVRLRNFAPFNSFLLHLQKPGLRFAASRLDWWERFDRNVKEGARPLLILWPFAPVALVYEVEDTEGPPLPHDIAQAFRANGGMTEYRISEMIDGLAKRGIETLQIEYGDGMAGNIVRPSDRTEVIRQSQKSKDPRDAKEKPHYRIRPNKAHNPNIRFATLTHELAHLFLGHLVADVYLKIPNRRRPSHPYREL